MNITKTDKLFALKTLEKKVKEEREALEAECRDTLLSHYTTTGNDRLRSPYFGNEAGTYTYIPPKEEEKTEYKVADWMGLTEFVNENPKSAEMFILANPQQFAEFWLERTGEIPDGITRSTFTVEKPGSTRLAVKADVVLEKLGGNFLEEVNNLMLGAGDE